jgi:hypothetical protein
MVATRILVLAANPSDMAKLHLAKELRKVQDVLALSAGRDQFEVISESAVRPEDLKRALLKYKPTIVHFSGHGMGDRGLVFENDAGRSKLVSATILARLFKLCPTVQCVVLNACYSEKQADAIAQHIQAVVGMNQDIGDRAAIKFAEGFYEGIGDGRSIEDAFEFGLLSIDLEGIPESATPVLKSRVRPEPLTPEPVMELPDPQGLEDPEGLVPLDSPFYVERSPVEMDCYDAVIKPHSLIRIKAPRQMGKTSLLVRILAHAESQGCLTVRLNLQTVESQRLNDLNEFLQWLCSSITEELDLADAVAEHWTETRGVVRRCQRYFERYLLKQIDRPLVLGLDEVDQVFEHPEIATDFFGMLRDWHEAGKTETIWRKLRLVIVHSKEVYIPLSINRSPFNVGIPIELRTLNKTETEELIHRHRLRFSNLEQQQLIHLVGGHPYILRAALYQLARGRTTMAQLLVESPTEGGLFNDHLRRHFLNLEADENLLNAFQQVITSSQPVQIGSSEAFRLSSMGLVRYQGNEVVPLCELYRQYFQQRLGWKMQR